MAKDMSAKAKKPNNKNNDSGKSNLPQGNKGKQQGDKQSKASVFFGKIGKGFRALRAELKNVSWPQFTNVIKQTGVVLVVTLFFLVVIGCFDLGLNALLKLLFDHFAA